MSGWFVDRQSRRWVDELGHQWRATVVRYRDSWGWALRLDFGDVAHGQASTLTEAREAAAAKQAEVSARIAAHAALPRKDW